MHVYLQNIQIFLVMFKREFFLVPVYTYLSLTVYENYTYIFWLCLHQIEKLLEETAVK